MDILKIIFIIVLLLFPLGEIARFEIGSGIAISVNDIGVGILIAFWMIRKILKREKIVNYLLKPILFFAGIGFLSLVVSSRLLNQAEFFVSILYLVRWIFYAGIIFVVSEFDLNFKKKIPFTMVFVGALIVIGGYLQYLFYPALRNLYYLGWDEHLYRMFSSFLDPNFTGTFFVLLLMLTAGLFFENLKNKKSWVLGFLGLLTLGAVFLTYSRSAFLMLLVSSSVFLFLINKKRFLIIIVLLLIIVSVILPKIFQSEGTNLLRVNSSIARIGSAQNSLEIIKDNPILGVGFNAYRYAQRRYGFLKDNSWQTTHSGAGTDNSFLFVLATTGIIGLIFYLYLWREILRYNWKVYREKSKKIIPIVLISSSFGLFVGAFFINSLFYTFIMEWMWILVGLNLTESN